MKTLKTLLAAGFRKKHRFVLARGCPVSVGDHVHDLSIMGKFKHVNFDHSPVFSVNLSDWAMRIKRFVNRWFHPFLHAIHPPWNVLIVENSSRWTGPLST